MREAIDKALLVAGLTLFAIAFMGIVLFYSALAATHEGAIKWGEGWNAVKSHYFG